MIVKIRRKIYNKTKINIFQPQVGGTAGSLSNIYEYTLPSPSLFPGRRVKSEECKLVCSIHYFQFFSKASDLNGGLSLFPPPGARPFRLKICSTDTEERILITSGDFLPKMPKIFVKIPPNCLKAPSQKT